MPASLSRMNRLFSGSWSAIFMRLRVAVTREWRPHSTWQPTRKLKTAVRPVWIQCCVANHNLDQGRDEEMLKTGLAFFSAIKTFATSGDTHWCPRASLLRSRPSGFHLLKRTNKICPRTQTRPSPPMCIRLLLVQNLTTHRAFKASCGTRYHMGDFSLHPSQAFKGIVCIVLLTCTLSMMSLLYHRVSFENPAYRGTPVTGVKISTLLSVSFRTSSAALILDPNAC